MRHLADYDPLSSFTLSETVNLIERIDQAIADFKNTPVKDRRAFAVFVLFKDR